MFENHKPWPWKNNFSNSQFAFAFLCMVNKWIYVFDMFAFQWNLIWVLNWNVKIPAVKRNIDSKLKCYSKRVLLLLLENVVMLLLLLLLVILTMIIINEKPLHRDRLKYFRWSRALYITNQLALNNNNEKSEMRTNNVNGYWLNENYYFFSLFIFLLFDLYGYELCSWDRFNALTHELLTSFFFPNAPHIIRFFDNILGRKKEINQSLALSTQKITTIFFTSGNSSWKQQTFAHFYLVHVNNLL